MAGGQGRPWQALGMGAGRSCGSARSLGRWGHAARAPQGKGGKGGLSGARGSAQQRKAGPQVGRGDT